MKYKYKYREVQFDNIQDAVLYKMYELVNKLFDKIDKDYEDKQNQIACHKDKGLDLARRFEEC